MGGYLNCLLTLLCETDQRAVELFSSRPVPNLVELAAGNSDSRSWIEAQGFDYGRIEAKQIIELLKQSTNVKGLGFTTRQALLPTIHAQAGSRRVARIFEVSFRPLGWSVRVERLADTDPRVVALQRETDAGNRPGTNLAFAAVPRRGWLSDGRGTVRWRPLTVNGELGPSPRAAA